MSKLFSRFNLQFTFITNIYISINFFFIMKILTDFRKMVETGMDLHVPLAAKSLVISLYFINKGASTVDFCV